MRTTVSITIAHETLRAVDELTGAELNRSRLIERAVLEYLERHCVAVGEQRDRQILDRLADELNREVEDVLGYQDGP